MVDWSLKKLLREKTAKILPSRIGEIGKNINVRLLMAITMTPGNNVLLFVEICRLVILVI